MVLAGAKTVSAVPCGELSSPNGDLNVVVSLDEVGTPHYRIDRRGRPVLLDSALGLVREDADFSRGLRFVEATAVRPIVDEYELVTSKRRRARYEASEATFRFATAQGARLEVVFRASNDGVALRYRFPETDATLRRIMAERTTFRFPADAAAWLQPLAVAKTGWEQTNPSYEEQYEQGIPVGKPSTLGAGWAFPALFRATAEGPEATWVLLSETGLGRTYCGCRLASESPGGEYAIALADPREVFPGGVASPESTLPWETPWRVIVVGSLATVVESTLGLDLAPPPPTPVDVSDLPGKAAWSWALLKDEHTVFDVQKRFVDYAHDMHWRYCLVDAAWDKQIGFERIAQLVEYARGKGVKIILWYNSAGSWNTTPYTPRDQLLTHDSRVQTFDRLKAIGVAGLKIDFFGGDGQSVIAYYLDILEDAAPYGFAINFHGATLPRGWQRTYPHLMTAEAIRGLEFSTFEQANADRAPTHHAMLPFTRNVFDPMDCTPVVLDRIPGITRRTTAAHELALSVLFMSGIQHYAEIPEGMAKAPDYVREFLREVPSIWDDVRLLAGEPGKYVVLARRCGRRWYVAGINGQPEPRVVELAPESLPWTGTVAANVITDGDVGGDLGPTTFHREQRTLDGGKAWRMSVPSYGGLAATIDAPVAE